MRSGTQRQAMNENFYNRLAITLTVIYPIKIKIYNIYIDRDTNYTLDTAVNSHR